LLDTTIEAQLSEITQLFLGQPLRDILRAATGTLNRASTAHPDLPRRVLDAQARAQVAQAPGPPDNSQKRQLEIAVPMFGYKNHVGIYANTASCGAISSPNRRVMTVVSSAPCSTA
jgi:hypothetical protein